MKTRHLILLVLALTVLFSAASVQTSARAAAAPVTVRVVVYRLNLRTDAGVQATRIAILKQGDLLTVLGQKKIGRVVWYKVQTANHQVGWVISSFIVSKSGSLTSVPVA